MTSQPELPPVPPQVQAAFEAMPKAAAQRLMAVRKMIYQAAEEAGVGPLTETLKWGEPAYLTEATKAGSTIRLGTSGERPAAFFNCNTTLVDGFREDFGTALELQGNRAVVLEGADEAALGICLHRALTYHRSKRTRR